MTASLYDVFEGKEILRKEYRTERELLRPLSHAIANDIYHALTGETGIFRSRIAFVGEDKGEKIFLSYGLGWEQDDKNRIEREYYAYLPAGQEMAQSLSIQLKGIDNGEYIC